MPMQKINKAQQDITKPSGGVAGIRTDVGMAVVSIVAVLLTLPFEFGGLDIPDMTVLSEGAKIGMQRFNETLGEAFLEIITVAVLLFLGNLVISSDKKPKSAPQPTRPCAFADAAACFVNPFVVAAAQAGYVDLAERLLASVQIDCAKKGPAIAARCRSGYVAVLETLLLKKPDMRQEADALLCEMERRGLKPDALCYSDLIRAHAAAEDFARAEKWLVRAKSVCNNYNGDTQTIFALVRRAISVSDFEKALYWLMFMMDQKASSETNAFEIYQEFFEACAATKGDFRGVAEALLARMLNKGLEPNLACYKAYFQGCLKSGAHQQAERRLQTMKQQGLKADAQIYELLITIAAKANEPKPAIAYFEEAIAQGESLAPSSWSAIIGIFARICEPEAAESWLERMHDETGFVAPAPTCNAVINAYAQAGNIDASVKLLEKRLACAPVAEDGSPSVDVISFNTLIATFAKLGEVSKAEHWLTRMNDCGLKADLISFNAVIHACAQAGDVVGAERWLGIIKNLGLTPDVISYNTIVFACARSGDVKKACDWLQKMEEDGVESDVISYSTIIDAWAKAGDVGGAMLWMEKMEKRGLEGNVVSYTSLINACAKGGDVAGAEKTLAKMLEKGLGADIVSYTCVINAYARANDPKGCARLMERMMEVGLEANAFSYNSVINAFARVGDLGQAESWFAEMRSKRLKPTIVSYTSLLNACANNTDASRSQRREDAERILRDCVLCAKIQPNQVTLRTLDRIFGDQRAQLLQDLGLNEASILANDERVNGCGKAWCMQKDRSGNSDFSSKARNMSKRSQKTA